MTAAMAMRIVGTKIDTLKRSPSTAPAIAPTMTEATIFPLPNMLIQNQSAFHFARLVNTLAKKRRRDVGAVLSTVAMCYEHLKKLQLGQSGFV